MKSELLLRIRDAESAAADRVARAEEEAEKIVADARREAEGILSDGREQVDHAYQARIDEARAGLEEETKKILSGGKRQATNLRKRFEAGIGGVTDRVRVLIEESL